MKAPLLRLLIAASILTASSGALAGGSAEASARALEHSLEALGYSIEGGLKLVSGAAAVPLITVGEIGKVSGEAGEELWEEANAPPRGPFPVTDEVVTVGPEPGEQLREPE
jgi:hypothetical protein